MDEIDTKNFKPCYADNNKTKKWPKVLSTVMVCNKGIEQVNRNGI